MCQTGCNGCGDCGGLECGTGEAGLDGLNAFTKTTAVFLQPDFGDPPMSVSVSALEQSTGTWVFKGQWLFIEDAGYFQATADGSHTTISLQVPSLEIEAINHLITPSGSGVPIGSGVSPSGVLGATGATGAAGSDGTNGTNGTTVLEVDLTEYEEDQNTFATVTKSFTVPENTWETVDDIVELEMMFVSDKTTTGYYGVRLELDSNVVEINPTLNDFYFSPDIDYAKLKIQLVLSAAGTVIPVSESETSTGAVYANNTNLGSPALASTRRGAAVTGLTTSAAIPLEVTLLSTVTGKNIKMFYYKLISMKK